MKSAHEKGVVKYLADPCIRKLASITESWGGHFQFMNVDTILKCMDRDTRRAKKRPGRECYYSTPEGGLDASLVVTTHWRRKVIYLSPEIWPVPKDALGIIIHEMGHVFADQRHPDDRKCDEWAWLGWEIRLARWANCYSTWDAWKSNGFSLGKKKDLPRHIAELWKKYDDSVCHKACPVCCDHPNYLKRRSSPLDAWAEWGSLNEKGKRLLTKDRIEHGLAIGIIDPRTKRPMPVQRPLEIQ